MRACRKVTSKLLTLPSATAIRTEANIPTAAVSLITEPEQAERIVATGKADAVFLLRNAQQSTMGAYGFRETWSSC
jgi:2,4-dienoyl-CoA reductase-like NADH-dependent reductase (Old Yellow Enzyme family)